MFRHSMKFMMVGVATVAAMATVGCSQKPQDEGSAQVSVHALSLAKDVAKVNVSVAGPGVTNTINLPLFNQGTAADPSWAGLVNHIPVGANRTFTAHAYDASNAEIYLGASSAVTITKNQIANVQIVLSEKVAPSGFVNHAPIIDSLSVSSTTVGLGDKVAYSVVAHDPDSDPFTFATTLTGSACGSFATSDAAATTGGTYSNLFTAASVAGTCTINMTVTDSKNAQAIATVTITVSAGPDVGGAKVTTTFQSYPIVLGVASSTPYLTPGTATTLTVTADSQHSDAKPLSYDFTSDCSATFTGGGASNVATVTVPSGSSAATCTINVKVSGPALPYTNGTAAALFTNAALTLNVGATTTSSGAGGIVIDLTSQSSVGPTVVVSGEEIPVVGGAQFVTLYAQARTTTAGAHLTSYAWSIANGGGLLGSQTDGAALADSQIVWQAPDPIVPAMAVKVTVTDSSGATASYTFKFAGDPCGSAIDGTPCSDGNPCTIGDSCQNHVCVAGTGTMTCTALDQCHVAGVCQPSTGACSNPLAAVNTPCNDSNACTSGDVCSATGVCGGSAVSCTVAAGDTCHVAGTCSDQGGQPVCSVVAGNDGTACDDSNACTSGTTCLSGSCQGGTTTVCTALDQCHTAGVCNATTGLCSSPVAANGTACNADNNLCTQNDSCQNGQCVVGAAVVCSVPDLCHQAGACQASTGVCAAGTVVSCPANEYCALSDGSCASCSTPSYAQQYPVTNLSGLVVDSAGSQYVVATMYNSGNNFGGITVSSAGGADIVLAKLNPATGAAVWAIPFSGASADENPGPADQFANGVAVSKSGYVGAIGNFTGGLQVGSTHLAGGASALDFIMASNNSGVGQWAKSANTQSGGLTAIAGNSNRDEFAVCGYAMGAMTDLGLPGVSGGDGAEDVVIAKLDAATGAVIWSKQIAAAGMQICSAIAMDSDGTVYASGVYFGAPDFGTGAFPSLANTVNAVWIAKLDSATGAAVASAHYGTAGKQSVRGIAVRGAGSSAVVALAGNVKSSLVFGGTTLTVSGSNADAFVAQLDSTLAVPAWAKSWGDTAVQEAHNVAFNSLGDIVVAGLIKGNATIGSYTLAAAGGANADPYYVKFRAGTGEVLCAANYGDSKAQSADFVAISTAAGANQDKINIGGYGAGTITFSTSPSIQVTSVPASASMGFIVQLTP